MNQHINNDTIMVTGGAGFLGSHLCDRLIEQDRDVLCVDNFFTGAKRNIRRLLDNPGFELIRHDITFPLYVEVGETYNLACPASPIHYQFDPVQTTKTSVHGAINMLGLAKRVRAKILQTSTSEVYGDPEISTRKPKATGEKSIQSVSAPASMKQALRRNPVLRQLQANINWTLRSSASSTPTARACTQTTATSYRT